jgi:TATA-box binding protein (TBP) (component of TFIID and TFIIIB)
MIYLIDEKKERQQNLGFSKDFFAKHEDVLFPIYNNVKLQEFKYQIFNDLNIILFHESFFDSPENRHSKDGLIIRKQLIEYSSTKNTLVVFFSGSIGSRSIDQNCAYIPVEILYQNLASFCDKYRNNTQVTLKEIVFGSSLTKEEILLLKNEIWENLYDMKDEENVMPNASLFRALEKLEILTGRAFAKEKVSNGFLKYQLKNI